MSKGFVDDSIITYNTIVIQPGFEAVPQHRVNGNLHYVYGFTDSFHLLFLLATGQKCCSWVHDTATDRFLSADWKKCQQIHDFFFSFSLSYVECKAE